MTKYRKKPVVIEAEQWFPGKTVPGVYEAFNVGYIDTLEGTLSGKSGDYVITGAKGEKYFCREDIFLETYEQVI